MLMIIYMTETGHKTDMHWAVCITEKALMTKYSKEAAQCSGTQHTLTFLSHCGQTLLSTKHPKSKINTCPAPNILAIHAFLSTDIKATADLVHTEFMLTAHPAFIFTLRFTLTGPAGLRVKKCTIPKAALRLYAAYCERKHSPL